jgi:site-specific DNA recombinase
MSKSYFGYVRVSTVRQGDGVSLDAQKEAIERYCSKQGLSLGQVFEEKETAAKQGRPVFADLISRLHRGDAQGVVMHKIDRSARNLRDWATVGDLQDAGIDVHFAAESVDFASRGGRLTADIQAVIAADYIRNLRDEIRKGQVGRLKQGLYPFSAPFGYLNCGKGQPKTICPLRGPHVRQMFELYATGQYSMPGLERELYAKGLRSLCGGKVYKGKIEQILNNPFYAGLIRLKGHPAEYQGIHKPIIDTTLYRRVQAIKEDRSRRKSTKHNHLYRGLFKCKVCSNSMIPERQRGHVYYRCHTKSCAPNSVREEALEWRILQRLSALQICSKDAVYFEEQLRKRLTGIHKTASRGSATRLELAKIAAGMDKLTTGYLEGLFDDETYRKRKEDYLFRKLELSTATQNRQSDQDKVRHSVKFLEHAKHLTRTYFYANPKEKRQLVEMMFSNMTVQDKNVEVWPQNWVCRFRFGRGVPIGADYKAENRSRSQLGLPSIEGFIEASNVQVSKDFVAIVDTIKVQSNTPEIPETAMTECYHKAA